jgi:exopolysaccharide biosynthesis polyprenyl glycosylphosphotransferase
VIKEHRRSFKVLRLLADLGLVTALYYALLGMTLYWVNPLALVLTHPDYAWRLPLLLLLCWALAFLGSGNYDRTRLSPSIAQSAMTAGKLLLVALVFFSLGLFAFKIQFLSRKFMAFYCLGSLALLTLSKSLEAYLLATLRGVGYNTLSVLFIGQDSAVQQLAADFERHADWGYRVVGLLADKKPAWTQPALRYLGPPAKLDQVLRTRIVDEVILALPAAGTKAFEAVLGQAASSGIRVRLLLPEALKGWSPQLDPLGGLMDSLDLSLSRRHPYKLMVKNFLEWVSALLAFTLLLPFLGLIAVAVLLSMGWPVFFVQKRAGRNGRVFKLYKFRTMVREARTLQAGLEKANEMKGPAFKIKHDPRITRFGRFLRRSSLDELPQFWNVLRGDLALVGPRAMAQYEARKVPAWALRRFSVKPGITCLREVSGRSQLSFEEWMRSDLDYLDRWSLGLDMQILLKTLPAVLSSRGAY